MEIPYVLSRFYCEITPTYHCMVWVTDKREQTATRNGLLNPSYIIGSFPCHITQGTTMSRTIRALAPKVRFNHKWYRATATSRDALLLVNPPEKVSLDHKYVKKSRTDIYRSYAVVPRGTPMATEAHEWSWFSGIQPNGKPMPVSGEWYLVTEHEETISWRERVYDWSEEASLWKRYLYVHGLRHREGYCRRQRANAIRHAKRRVILRMRLEGKMILRGELADHYG